MPLEYQKKEKNIQNPNLKNSIASVFGSPSVLAILRLYIGGSFVPYGGGKVSRDRNDCPSSEENDSGRRATGMPPRSWVNVYRRSSSSTSRVLADVPGWIVVAGAEGVYTGRDGSIGFRVLAASNVGLSSDWMCCCRTEFRGELRRVGRGCEFNTGSSISNDCGLAIDIDIRWCQQLWKRCE